MLSARQRTPAVAAVLLLGALAVAAPPSTADPTPADIRSEQASLQERERALLHELYLRDARLERARAAAAAAEARIASLRAEAHELGLRTRLARRNFSTARRHLRAHLVVLYKRRSPDPVEVLLGAGSIEEALHGVDALGRLAAADRRIVGQTREARRLLAAARLQLQLNQRAAEEQRRTQAVAVDALERERVAKLALLRDVRDRQVRLAGELDRLERIAAEAARRAQALSQAAPRAAAAVAAAAPAAPPSVTAPRGSPVRGMTTFMVEATAYSLSGNTASGLPAGPGVCAVDPAVIPLGSAIDVPGYGRCVAADTGSAIVGARIDVWLPRAGAMRFGRHTVTVTVR